jgi:hypothetical protein
VLTRLSGSVLLVLAFCRPGDLGASRSAQASLSTPRFDYATTLGCGDVFFHAVNSAGTEVLEIEADFAQLRGASVRQAFDLTKPPLGVVVAITLYSERQVNRPNCSDVFITEVGKPPVQPELWWATRGTLSVERGPKGVKPEEPWLLRVRLRLERAAFRGPSGQILEMARPFTWEGYVGWQAG